MSYYDDIGVSATATAEEIHDRYRALARLFHPDQQADAGLKAVAEMQMRRFNHIYSVLSDAEKRRHYNAELGAAAERVAPIIIHAPRPVPERAPAPWGTIAWVSAVAASGGLIVWLSSHESPMTARPSGVRYSVEAEATAVPETPQNVTDPVTRALIEQLREQVKAAVEQRNDAWKLLTQLRQENMGRKTESPAMARLIAPSPPAETHARAEVKPVAAPAMPPPPVMQARLPEPAPLEPPPSLPGVANAAPLNLNVPQRSRFAGIWFWAKPVAGNKNPALYPPEFIETTIVEQNGQLHGKYRARYRVSDRAISPNVNFDFDGKAAGGAAQFLFAGDGGARGEVKIKMISDTSMEVKWSATDLGKSMGLAAGTAVLMRRSE